MSTLYLAWQYPRTRRWFPIGRLVRDQSAHEAFVFTYVEGAKAAKKEAGFKPIPEFPVFDQAYRAHELFPTFRNRAMNTSRADRAEYLRQLGLDASACDAMAELSASGGRSHTDKFEVFPEMEPEPDGRFRTELPLHGLRHTNRAAVEAVERLKAGDDLGVALELTNPVARFGLLVHTGDYCTLGWLPRYFVEAINECCDWKNLEVSLTVARVNRQAPLSHRVRVNISGRLPQGTNPMRTLPLYQPIVDPNGSAGLPTRT